MSRAQLILGFLGFAFFAQVAAHGHLSVPTTRDYLMRQDQQNAPNEYPLKSDFVCRNYSSLPPSMWTTLVAGSTTTMTWAMEAAHPGDCFAYISYDGDNVEDSQKKWFKIAQFDRCNMQNLQKMTLNIPSYLPPCEHCILRWEWYALHLQAINIVEFYAQCSDVKIIGNPNGQLPSPQVTIPGHLPMDAIKYRPGFNSDVVLFTGPPIATIGGAPYSCESTYGSSCKVPSPTNNPCTISTQRCMSATTYQACGIGATTTVWGVEQACQTGLVCANHTDGIHIMCTYPSVATPAIPSTPGSVTPTPSSSSDVCKLSNMRCLSDTSYQTCTNGNSGTFWATQQSCQTGLYCNANGNTIFCGSTKPSSSTPTPVSTTAAVPVVIIPSTPISTPPVVSTTSRPLSTSRPFSTTSRPSMPSTTSSKPIANMPCSSGDQKCTSVGSTTYQTCSAQRDGSTSWAAAQTCQTGQTCHPSATANNIYCY